MTDNQYDWELCFTDGGNGHSLWLDRITNRYSIKDQSGDRPHLTDDGVVWLGKGLKYIHTDKEKNGQAFIHIYNNKLTVRFPVFIVRANRKANCYCVFEFAMKVAEKLNMKLEFSLELKKLEPFFSQIEKELSNEIN